MSARSKARKRALDILYAADIRGVEPLGLLAEGVELREANAEPALNAYVATLVEGVVAKRDRIDELLSTYSMGWTLDRMPAVDRSILRLGVYEICWQPDVPDSVAIAEAVALAQDLSTDESTSFVNGLLGRIAEIKDRLDLADD